VWGQGSVVPRGLWFYLHSPPAMNRGAIVVYPPTGHQIKVSAYAPRGGGLG
jgi:hypothetical protein